MFLSTPNLEDPKSVKKQKPFRPFIHLQINSVEVWFVKVIYLNQNFSAQHYYSPITNRYFSHFIIIELCQLALE